MFYRFTAKINKGSLEWTCPIEDYIVAHNGEKVLVTIHAFEHNASRKQQNLLRHWLRIFCEATSNDEEDIMDHLKSRILLDELDFKDLTGKEVNVLLKELEKLARFNGVALPYQGEVNGW